MWYKTVPVGIHTINNFMKTMIEKSPLNSTSQKKITNHSVRKTVVKKLKSAGFDKADIIDVTGHSSTHGLNSYDEGDMFKSKTCRMLLI